MITHKRGDTLAMIGTVKFTEAPLTITDFTGWQIRCQIRLRATRAPQDGVTATWANAATGIYQLDAPASATAQWVVGECETDIEFTDTLGNVISTPTQRISVIQDVTL